MTVTDGNDASTQTGGRGGTDADGPVAVVAGLRRVDVTGDDRTRYLEDVTTQHLADAAIGDLRGALYLDPHGAPLAMFDVVVLGDRLVLLAPDDAVAGTLVDTLGGRTFLLDATFTLRDDEAVSVRGAGAPAALAAIGLGYLEGRCRLADDVLVVARADGADLVAPPATLGPVVDALIAAGARRGDAGDLERARIRGGVPAWGREVVPPHLPEEAGLLPTHVHLAKGCYPGQEAVARMWMLGRPRRRLAVVRLGGDAGAVGWRAGDGRQAAHVTSVDPDGALGLAYVPADSVPGTEITGPDGGIEVLRLVGTDDPPGHDPSMRRRRDAG